MTAADLVLQFLLVVVGAVVVWDPRALTDSLEPSRADAAATSPTPW